MNDTERLVLLVITGSFLYAGLLMALCGWACAEAAESKGRSWNTWFALGLLFSVIAILAIGVLPDIRGIRRSH